MSPPDARIREELAKRGTDLRRVRSHQAADVRMKPNYSGYGAASHRPLPIGGEGPFRYLARRGEGRCEG